MEVYAAFLPGGTGAASIRSQMSTIEQQVLITKTAVLKAESTVLDVQSTAAEKVSKRQHFPCMHAHTSQVPAAPCSECNTFAYMRQSRRVLFEDWHTSALTFPSI